MFIYLSDGTVIQARSISRIVNGAVDHFEIFFLSMSDVLIQGSKYIPKILASPITLSDSRTQLVLTVQRKNIQVRFSSDFPETATQKAIDYWDENENWYGFPETTVDYFGDGCDRNSSPHDYHQGCIQWKKNGKFRKLYIDYSE